jgi:aspartyl-tRNA(Asn)/glutamyl-tRNA(Gln) amidotransferase subunit B
MVPSGCQSCAPVLPWLPYHRIVNPAAQQRDITSVRLKVGMEVHVELSARAKMFAAPGSPAHPEFDAAPPNSLLDPTVLGLPGALPTLNRGAIELAMLVGLALGCEIAPVTKWDRKSYFYPDLPKGYQISQYDLPLCFGGAIDVPGFDEAGFIDPQAPSVRIGIHRAHLEEDAGKLLHEPPQEAGMCGSAAERRAPQGTLVDLNRAGTALLEIVTQPDFESADQAVAFARLLRLTCRFLGVTEGVMQKGHMRFEPNINTIITTTGGQRIETPIAEVKNLNSFRSLRLAIEHELAEQPKRWIADGREMGPGSKRTMGWDDARGITLLQREKEEAEDYRYFPDPDLLPLTVDRAWVEQARARLPELPAARVRRYLDEFGLPPRQAGALVEERGVCELFEQAVDLAAQGDVIEHERAGRMIANLLLQTCARLGNERGARACDLGISAAQLAAVAQLREAAPPRISSNGAEAILERLAGPDAGADVEEIAQREGLLLVRDEGALEAWCDEVIAANGPMVEQIRAGKHAAIGRLIGEVLKRSGGAADPKAVRAKLLERIG